MSSVSPSHRFTEQHPCPVCGGHQDLPQGQGVRCWGYRSTDDRYAHCTREEYAGPIAPHGDGGTYPHRLDGPCQCGTEHGPGFAIPAGSLGVHRAYRNGNGAGHTNGAINGARNGHPMADGSLSKASTNGKHQAAAATPPATVVRETDYRYVTAAGQLVAIHRRRDLSDGRKKMLWLTGDGTISAGHIKPDNLPLYRLPELLAAYPEEAVYFTEGEKACDAARTLGVVAVCAGGGSGQRAFGDAFGVLAGRIVYLLPDHDAKGAQYMEGVTLAMRQAGAYPVTVDLGGVEPGDDIVEWIANTGGTAVELQTLAAAALERARADGSFSTGDGLLRGESGIEEPEDTGPPRDPRHPGIVIQPLAWFLEQEDEAQPWLVEELLPAGGSSLLVAKPKAGKCLALGTLVRMADGSVRAVETIQAGDAVMGPDSEPRTVLSTTAGTGPLYRIDQRHGPSYTVNEAHQLTLVCTATAPGYVPGTVVDPTVTEVLAKPRTFLRRYRGFRVAWDAPERALPVEPYFLGMWLADGNAANVLVTNVEPEVAEYLADYARRLGMELRTTPNSAGVPALAITRGRTGGAPQWTLQGALRALGVLNSKAIPDPYLQASLRQRRELLAGIIDGDGYYDRRRHSWEVTQKRRELAEQIGQLCESLGLRVRITPKLATIRERGYTSTVWRVSIRGNLADVPVRVPRKRQTEPPCKVDMATTPITITPVGVGDYYGFALDGDGRFLLGDGTVTHNSTLARTLIAAVLRGEPFLGRRVEPGPVLYLAIEERPASLREQLRVLGLRHEPLYLATGMIEERGVPIVEQLRAVVEETGAVLVVVDPLFKLMRVKDSNDYAETSRVLEPLTELARRTSCHLLIVHHANKGSEGAEAILGSTALAGAVDTIMLLKREEATRTLTTRQRYGPDLEPTILDKDETGRVAANGTSREARIREFEPLVQQAIAEGAFTADQVLHRVKGDTNLIRSALAGLVASGLVEQTGTGRRGSPFEYRLSEFYQQAYEARS